MNYRIKYEKYKQKYLKKYEKLYNEKFNKKCNFSGTIDVFNFLTGYNIYIELVVKDEISSQFCSKNFIIGTNKILNGAIFYNNKTITLCGVHLINILDDLDELVKFSS